tara:strand:+ start:13677 stop:18491 length:4815 start_codon:yes stop_codon:yes gene_type:complete
MHPSIRIEGSILTGDIIETIASVERQDGQRSQDFGFPTNTAVKDEIADAWASARAFWTAYQSKIERLREGASGVTETRNQWITPLLGLLGYTPELAGKGEVVNQKNYAISHRDTNRAGFPIHVMGWHDSLDKKRQDSGPRMSPHALVQEYINLTEHLYAVVTNGRQLRLLRDSSRLIKLSFLEFDLERMFNEEIFSDFRILFRLLHSSRMPVKQDAASESIIERYHQDALDSGSRIREGLSGAVEACIRELANGFLSHDKNGRLRETVSTTPESATDLYQHLLRLIYRMLFLMVIEERRLVYPATADARLRTIYERFYSIGRIRKLAEKRHFSEEKYHDAWDALCATFRLFAEPEAGNELGLAPLGGIFHREAIGTLADCRLSNAVLLTAIRRLSYFQHPDTKQFLRVNYGALNVEEFGSVYEGLLEYDAKLIEPSPGHYEFHLVKGEGRASSGSHYTPDELVQPLLKHSIDYLITDRLKQAGEVAGGEWRVASSEWRKVSEQFSVSESVEFTKYWKGVIDGVLSGTGGMEAGYGFSGVRLQVVTALSKIGVVWNDQPDEAGGGLNTGQHSRGLGASEHEGVSTLHPYRQRQSEGTGDALAAEPKGRPYGVRGDQASPADHNYSGKTASFPTPLALSPQQLANLWNSLPLSTRHSLLAEQALLSLRVADIACGSGHILLAAARRIGTELAILRTGEEQPSPTAMREAVRDVIRNCIYGVDLNPLAVELCKVALWLEAHVPGQPLNFLDHHIKCGNAIVGFVHQEELEKGIPMEAFKTLPGDDKEVAAALRKRNKEGRADDRRQVKMKLSAENQEKLDQIRQRWQELSGLPERTPTEIEAKRKQFRQFSTSQDAYLLQQIAAIPIAQFYQPKTLDNKHCVITEQNYRDYLTGRLTVPAGQATASAWAIADRKKFFHWFLEFPEIMQGGGFDCILGNPPYLGNRRLKGTYGASFLEWVCFEYKPAGSVDLAVYFLRRMFELISESGFISLITTNTIAQGGARVGGLEYALNNEGTINFAAKSIRWPGLAAVNVSLLSLYKGKWSGQFNLDGKSVERITSLLDDGESDLKPSPLVANSDRSFVGSYVLGKGFMLDIEEGEKLHKTEGGSKVVFPYLNGKDLNNSPEQKASRLILNFRNLAEDQARELSPDCFSIIEERVKPDRTRLKENGDFALRKPLPQRWWMYADKRPALYRTISDLERVLVIAQVSKTTAFTFVPKGQVYDAMLIVFPFEGAEYLAVMQSNFHTQWAWRYCTTMKTDLRYGPSVIFEPFPFPELSSDLARVGECYYEHRKATMLLLWLGLTKIYNLFHDPDLSPELVAKVSGKPADIAQQGYSALLKLRELHLEMDTAVRDAYGWTDLNLSHGFHDLDYLPENDRTRYTISPAARKEVLQRLLKLNHERHAEEKAAGLHDKKAKKKAAKKRAAKPKSDLINLEMEGLFDESRDAKPLEVRTMPSQPRGAMEADEYLMEVIPAILLEAKGRRLRWTQFTDAIRLLARSQKLQKAAVGDDSDLVERWSKAGTPQLALSEVVPAIQQMGGRNFQITKEDGEHFIRLSASNPPAAEAWPAYDAWLAMRIVSASSVNVPFDADEQNLLQSIETLSQLFA